MQGIYGQPGSASTLESVFNNFTGSLQALTTTARTIRRRGRRW